MNKFKIKINLDGEQEDKIVAKSLKRSYSMIQSTPDPHESSEYKKSLKKAFKRVYEYYSGKSLK